MPKCLYFVLALVLLFSFVQAESVEEKIQRLEAKVQQLESRLSVCQDETSYKEYTEDIVREYLQSSAIEDDRIALTAGYDKGFFIRDTEGAIELKISGYLQLGFESYENNTKENNGFFTKNDRINLELFIMKNWHIRFEFKCASDVEITHAYIEYLAMPELSVLVGNTSIPFSMQAPYKGYEGITILANPFVSSWGHGRDLGVMVRGVIGNMFKYSAGLFNGVGSHELNEDDELLAAANIRWYYCGYKENSNNFIHVGVMANRADNLHAIDIATLKGFARKENLVKREETDDWKLGLDIACKYVANLEGGHSLRFEAEAMAVRWDRAGVRGNIVGYGATAGIQYRHCLTPDIKNSGIIFGANFSYNDIDNHGGPAMGLTQPETQALTAYIYTFVLGYAFNSHVDVSVNWVIMDLDQKDGAKDSNHNTGSLEQAWLLQLIAKF